MDSRKCSAALGFTLLIVCVIGIVIIIYNSGPTKRSSESSSPAATHYNHHVQQHHHHRASSATVVGGKAGSSGDHFGSAPKLGFANDPNYRSSQPTMQDVNQLADELRLLSSKSKHVPSSSSTGRGNPVNTGTVTAMKKTNGSLPSTSSSATSSVKASISAVNYSSVPKKGPLVPPPSVKGLLTLAPALSTPVAASILTNSSSLSRNPSPQSLAVDALETPLNQQQILQHHHNHNQKPYRGHPAPASLPSLPTQMMVDSAERRALAPHENTETGVGGEGKAHNDLYTTSWHPSMVSPAGGGAAAPNYPYRQYLPMHPQSHRFRNNNPPRPSSPARINKTGKDTGYDYNSNQGRVPNSKQYQERNQQHQPNPEKEEIEHEEDGDFVELDVDDNEDDVYSNQGNVKKEEEGGDDNDTTDDNEQDEEDVEEDDEEEEEDEYDNGANPGILMEPKNLAADLETLFSLANHLYTSPASLLSTLAAQTSTNSTKKTGAAAATSGFPVAFQGFLKVINETIHRGNSSKLLVELNEKYRGREARMNSKTANVIGLNSNSSGGNHTKIEAFSPSDLVKNNGGDKQQSPYEKSLTAFIFMSFGVFLLNQIHSFVQKTADEHLKHHGIMSNSTIMGEGRAFHWEEDGPFAWYSPRNGMIMTTESSSLDVLFRPPVSPNNSTVGVLQSFDSVSGRSNNHHGSESEATMSEEGHLNNMFRALLNIGNAYSNDSPDLECIWSLYCQDLDQTAKKDGLYGVAARINSVGLRLIMKQIPPALTFDVILRSLVGWDGLPCRKMFPDCAVDKGTMSLVIVEEENAGMKKVVKNV